jgi:hypothetical protein
VRKAEKAPISHEKEEIIMKNWRSKINREENQLTLRESIAENLMPRLMKISSKALKPVR